MGEIVYTCYRSRHEGNAVRDVAGSQIVLEHKIVLDLKMDINILYLRSGAPWEVRG
jgi:hypothetical protein